MLGMQLQRTRVRHGCAHRAYRHSLKTSAQSQTASIRPPPPAPEPALKRLGQGECYTVFRWPAALDGSKVFVVGTFNKWSELVPLEKAANGDHVAVVPCPAEPIQFKYVVDRRGKTYWSVNPTEALVVDPQNMLNNVRGTASTEISMAADHGLLVTAYGDFSAWADEVPLHFKEDAQEYSALVSLPRGSYKYRFLKDGVPTVLKSRKSAVGEDGNLYNVLEVKSMDGCKLFYRTGWKSCSLKARFLRDDGSLIDDKWLNYTMTTVPTKELPKNPPDPNTWKVADIMPLQGAAQIEFYIQDDNDRKAVDKPTHQQYYKCPATGSFKLRRGRLAPFLAANQLPVMLSSDIDGTMVGDDKHADLGTAAFKEFWESSAALANGVLVYNTGRSIGSVTGLLEHKKDVLAVPDVVISAVGTQVWLLDLEALLCAKEMKYVQDEAWAARLNEGWDQGRARHVADQVLNKLRGSNGHDSITWVDDGREHPHRLALGVRADLSERVMMDWMERLKTEGIQARLVRSGTGNHRYVDCVPINAGKLEAMEHVRQLYGIPASQCVSAGDSGNDILMLEGSNPAIVVGNAQQELLDWVAQQRQDGRLIVTEGNCAWGILEGLYRHFKIV